MPDCCFSFIPHPQIQFIHKPQPLHLRTLQICPPLISQHSPSHSCLEHALCTFCPHGLILLLNTSYRLCFFVSFFNINQIVIIVYSVSTTSCCTQKQNINQCTLCIFLPVFQVIFIFFSCSGLFVSCFPHAFLSDTLFPAIFTPAWLFSLLSLKCPVLRGAFLESPLHPKLHPIFNSLLQNPLFLFSNYVIIFQFVFPGSTHVQGRVEPECLRYKQLFFMVQRFSINSLNKLEDDLV